MLTVRARSRPVDVTTWPTRFFVFFFCLSSSSLHALVQSLRFPAFRLSGFHLLSSPKGPTRFRRHTMTSVAPITQSPRAGPPQVRRILPFLAADLFRLRDLSKESPFPSVNMIMSSPTQTAVSVSIPSVNSASFVNTHQPIINLVSITYSPLTNPIGLTEKTHSVPSCQKKKIADTSYV